LFSEFFCDGVTAFDEHYFNTQKNRRLLELSLVIPQLKKYPSVDRRPSKRTKTSWCFYFLGSPSNSYRLQFLYYIEHLFCALFHLYNIFVYINMSFLIKLRARATYNMGETGEQTKPNSQLAYTFSRPRNFAYESYRHRPWLLFQRSLNRSMKFFWNPVHVQ
jgi:hypothetical protein